MKDAGLDSKYSWLVAIAGSLIFLLSSWPVRIGGQIFVSLLDSLNINRKAASIPFSTAYLMRSVAGPFAGYFGERIGLKNITLIGCFLCATGMFGCFFAEDIIALGIFMGLIYGFGLEWATAVIPEILNQHFDKHFAKANGVVHGGSGFGAFVTPPLIVIITKTFGISGTFLIMSAIILNGVPLAMLLTESNRKKMPYTKEDTEKSSNLGNHTENFNMTEVVENACMLRNTDHKSHYLLSRVTSKDNFESNKNEVISHNKNNSKTIKNSNNFDSFNEKNVILHESKLILNQSCKISTSFKQISFDKDINVVKNSKQLERQNLPILLSVCKLKDEMTLVRSRSNSIKSEKRSSDSLNLTSTKSSYSSLKILFSPLYLLMTTIQSSHFYVMYISWTITVDVARDKGAKEDQEAYFVMGLALFDMIGRSFFGALTDSGCMSRVSLNVISFACMGFCCLMLTWVSGFFATLFIICMLGLSSGSNTTGLPGIVNQFFQNEERSMVMASRLLMYAPMSFTMAPLIGYFREVFGSYDGLLYLLTSICTVCSMLLILLSRLYSNR